MSTTAPQGTLAAVLEVARRNIGFVEMPNNGNPYAAVVGHANHQPWCASFLAAVFFRAGVPLPSTSAYTPTMAAGFKRAGRWSHTGQKGDVVFFEWPSMGRIAHVGVVEEVRSDGSYLTIEGNTDSAGGRTGGRVMRQVRRANIAGFGRPVYRVPVVPPVPGRVPVRITPVDEARNSPVLEKGDTRPAAKIKDVQRALHKLGFLKGAQAAVVDGHYGQKTYEAVRAFQRAHRMRVDGVTGPATWAKLREQVHRR